MTPPYLRETPEGVYLSVKLQPRASRNQLQGPHGNELKIAITSPPVDSAANKALVEFLASELQLSRSTLQLVRGQTSRHKTIFIAGRRASDVAKHLSP
jgi:uncharacterized protein (TIGR00251 family)